jgi:hypothetical protein
MTPSCSPVDPRMTRTSRARIRPFTRICGCRLDQSPQRQNGSAPPAVFHLSQFPASAFANARTLILRHGCDSPQRSARIKVRKPKRSCKQQSRTGKVKLVTIGVGPQRIIFPAGRQSAPCAPCTQRHRRALNRLLLPMARVSRLRRKWRGRQSRYQSQTRVVA